MGLQVAIYNALHNYPILCCLVNFSTQCLDISRSVYLYLPAYLSLGASKLKLLLTCTFVEALVRTIMIHMDTSMNKWVQTWLQPDLQTCCIFTTNACIHLVYAETLTTLIFTFERDNTSGIHRCTHKKQLIRSRKNQCCHKGIRDL